MFEGGSGLKNSWWLLQDSALGLYLLFLCFPQKAEGRPSRSRSSDESPWKTVSSSARSTRRACPSEPTPVHRLSSSVPRFTHPSLGIAQWERPEKLALTKTLGKPSRPQGENSPAEIPAAPHVAAPWDVPSPLGHSLFFFFSDERNGQKMSFVIRNEFRLLQMLALQLENT